jgi:hypothetical protein
LSNQNVVMFCLYSFLMLFGKPYKLFSYQG